MKLENGRPSDESGRLLKEIKVYDLLDSLNISYQRTDHAPAMTMEACEEIDDVLGAKMCKNLFLCNRQETQFYILLMPGDKPFRTKELSAQLGVARLSFAKEEHMERLLGLTPGSVSIMGLMNDAEKQVQLVIDSDVLKDEYLCFHPCINTSSLKVETSAMMSKVIPALGAAPIIVEL